MSGCGVLCGGEVGSLTVALGAQHALYVGHKEGMQEEGEAVEGNPFVEDHHPG